MFSFKSRLFLRLIIGKYLLFENFSHPIEVGYIAVLRVIDNDFPVTSEKFWKR